MRDSHNVPLTHGFKSFKCKSYSVINGVVKINKKTPATDWSLYLKDVFKSCYGQFKVEPYKDFKGIKKIQFYKTHSTTFRGRAYPEKTLGQVIQFPIQKVG